MTDTKNVYKRKGKFQFCKVVYAGRPFLHGPPLHSPWLFLETKVSLFSSVKLHSENVLVCQMLLMENNAVRLPEGVSLVLFT